MTFFDKNIASFYLIIMIFYKLVCSRDFNFGFCYLAYY